MMFRVILGAIVLLLPCCLCERCTAFFLPTAPTDVYLMSLDMEKMSADLTEFKGEGVIYNLPFIGFLSHGYFTYKAEAPYFDRLKNSIPQVPCKNLAPSFSYWEKDGFKGELINADQCFFGTLLSFQHFIFYDSSSKQVQHFTDGIRD